ncbi:MAG: glucose-6-phosphate isomerase [Clostridiales bacterium]|nr:glucose-6-phosphate isomerase [Clostridiales bacterium]
MKLKFDYNNMMDSAIGAHGIKKSDIDKAGKAHEAAYADVINNSGKGWQEWTETPLLDKKTIDELNTFGSKIREKASSFVVLGIGGSALGPICVFNALLHLHHNELPEKMRKAPKIYVEDNVDPERMSALLDVIDIKTTYFNVITKSGETSETLSQLLIVYNLLKKAVGEAEAKQHITVTTTIGKGSLYALAEKEGFKIYGIPSGVGGRFSVLSNVGLVPFAVMGIDIESMLGGARAMRKACEEKDIYKNPALMTAFLQVLSMKQGKNISVMMPYADGLRTMADFYCQLWAESLGKAVDKKGKTVNCGQTPAKSLGVTDQHSQVQLYTEGPYDKVVTFIGVENFGATVDIPKGEKAEVGDFLKGHTLNELINAERKATEFALTKAGRSNYTVLLPEVTAETVGELLMYFMYITAFAGAYLDIDTFNQPGVEEGKKATFAMIGRAGYESKLAEINSSPKSNEYVIG